MAIALDNAFGFDRSFIYPLRTRIEMIAAAGYTGVSCVGWLYSMRKEPFWSEVERFTAWGCPLRSVYMSMPAATEPDGKRANWARDALDHLPTGAHLELSLEGTPGDPAPATMIRRTLAALADHAAKRQRIIALYPHKTYWMLRVKDAVALCAELNHPALRLCFPSSHWLSVSGLDAEGNDVSPADDIAAAAPWLHSANLCGGRRGKDGYENCLLDEGHFDATAPIVLLRRQGFQGEFTIQAWEAAGDPWTALVRNRTWLAAAEERSAKLILSGAGAAKP